MRVREISQEKVDQIFQNLPESIAIKGRRYSFADIFFGDAFNVERDNERKALPPDKRTYYLAENGNRGELLFGINLIPG